MTYQAPVSDIAFSLKHAAGFMQALAGGLYGDLAEDDVDAILEEAGRSPAKCLRRSTWSATAKARISKTARVTMPAGWKDAYADLGRRPAGTGSRRRKFLAARPCPRR